MWPRGASPHGRVRAGKIVRDATRAAADRLSRSSAARCGVAFCECARPTRFGRGASRTPLRTITRRSACDPRRGPRASHAMRARSRRIAGRRRVRRRDDPPRFARSAPPLQGRERSTRLPALMRIAIPLETAPREQRVALVPDTVGRLVKAGFAVAVQAGAGERAGHLDDAYRQARATIEADFAATAAGSAALLVVREPIPAALDPLPAGAAVLGLLGRGENAALVQRALERPLSLF